MFAPLALMALCANAGTGKYSRMMPGFNFGSHNVAGCGRTISPFAGTATDCQAACDKNSGCDMWTYVAGPHQPAKPPTPYPWCCQKGCRSNATGLSLCPAPNREVNATSGVKDPKDYGVSPPPPPCVGDACFQFAFDEASGNASTSFPTLGRFGVRKVEAFLYKPDGKTYAYADIVNYTCTGWTKDPKSCPPGEYFYPDSYSTEVGVFSSPDGLTQWEYHGIVVPRGPAGGWDSGGIASPGAAAAKDGSVIVGYAAENSPVGGRNRGIGVAIASHPLGPFVKQVTPIASPKTICSGTGRCDDVIMQSRPDGVHIYHSVKGSNVKPGDGIRHRMSSDGGKKWGASALVLSTKLQPGHVPAESILGKFFPTLNGGRMVLITDGGKGFMLHAYVSKTVGSMTEFVAASGEFGPSMFLNGAPPGPARPGSWANYQVAFFPDADGSVARVGYTLWQNNTVKSRRAPAFGMTMRVFTLINVSATKVKTDDRSSTVGLAATPPMGFNNCNVATALGLSNWTCCSGTQKLFEAIATAIKDKGLLAKGYEYVNMDDGWMHHDRSEGVGKGVQVPVSWKFPDFPGMISKIHGLGLKFGLYTAMGNQSCCKRATACKNEKLDANQYAKWGVDYVKDDSCSGCPGRSGGAAENLWIMQQALDATGRKIMLSGEGGPDPKHCSVTGQCGNLRRIGHDITPFWSSIASMIDLSYRLAPFAHNASTASKSGFWNDMDILEIGNGEFDCSTPQSINRAKAHFSMWSVMKAPLLLGTDLTFTTNPELEKTVLDIVGNSLVIGINQDPLGVQARRVSSVPGPAVAAGTVTNADVTFTVQACDARRPTQRWRHTLNASSASGPLWTSDSTGRQWCATTLAAGMWNIQACDSFNASSKCQGADGLECRDGIKLCQFKTGGYHHSDECKPVDPSVTGTQLVNLQEWQGLNGGYDSSTFGSGPVPHSRYMVIQGQGDFEFDLSLSTGEGGTISPKSGSKILDDDNVGSAKEVNGSTYCLDVALGGNLEVWTAPLTGGRVVVALFNRSPAAANVTATWAMLGLASGSKHDASDLWQKGKIVGSGLTSAVSAMTPSRAVTLLVLTPTKIARVKTDDTSVNVKHWDMDKAMAQKRLSYAEQVLVFALQGLVNKLGAPPVLSVDAGFLDFDWHGANSWWRGELEKHGTASFTNISDVAICGLVAGLDIAPPVTSGVVLYTSAAPLGDGYTMPMVLTLASQQRLLPVTPEILLAHPCLAHLPVGKDMRIGKMPQMESRAMAWRWAIDELLPNASSTTVFNIYHYWSGVGPARYRTDPQSNATVANLDYNIQHKAFILDLDPSIKADALLLEEILGSKHLKPMYDAFGWHGDEPKWVAAVTEGGGTVFCSFASPDLSFWALLKAVGGGKARKLPSGDSDRLLDKSKYYVTFETNEGDTPRIVLSAFASSWASPQRGSVPVAWAVDALLSVRFPAMMDYFAATATSNESFIGGVAGAGYVHLGALSETQLQAYATRAGEVFAEYMPENAPADAFGWANWSSLNKYKAFAAKAGQAPGAFVAQPLTGTQGYMKCPVLNQNAADGTPLICTADQGLGNQSYVSRPMRQVA